MGQNESVEGGVDTGLKKHLEDNKKSSDIGGNMIQTVSEKDLKKYWEDFGKKYPSGKLRRQDFINENLKERGLRPEIWGTVFDIIDSDGNRYIDFQEYMIFLVTLDETKSAEEMLSQTFDLVDLDGSGDLDEGELRWIVNVIAKEQFYKDEANFGKSEDFDANKYADELFVEMDENGDGVVDKNEFLKACLNNPKIRDVLTTPLHQVQVMLKGSLGTSRTEEFDDPSLSSKTRLEFRGDRIYKPLETREFKFYEDIEACNDELLKSFMPGYYGRDYIDHYEDNSLKTQSYLILENLTYGMKRPCIMDCIMGVSEQQSESEKVLGKLRKNIYHLKDKLGFRVAGMQVWKFQVKQKRKRVVSEEVEGEEDENITKNSDVNVDGENIKGFYYNLEGDKAERLTLNRVDDEFWNFLNNVVKFRKDIAQTAVSKLRIIEKYFETQTRYRFLNSSIFFIYDAMQNHDDIHVKMMNFSDVEEKREKDTDFLLGLKCLIAIFESIASGQRLAKEETGGRKPWYEKIKVNNKL